MLQATSWTHRRETADRVDVEVLALSSPDGAERADVGTAAWLGESLELRLAAADDHVAFVLGSGERAAASMRRLIGGPHTPLSMNTRVRRALESLPDSPRAILLIDAGPAFALTVQAAQSFGAPIPALPLQSTYAPLISLGAWLEADAVRAELFLPAETVREMIDSLRPGSAADRAH
jgi:hypothetical protein